MIFKGIFWKVIGNQTIPVKTGDKDNLLSILTTYYLPAWAGYALVALIIVALVVARIRSRAKRRSYGFEVESGELVFSKLFVTSQALILAVIVLGRFRGVPLSLTVLGAVAFIIWIITNHTRFGRYLYAIGGNEEAAVISGVPVMAVTIGAFIIAGITATITGFMQTAYSGASTTTTGELMELDAIASCVIGGTALAGGRGTVAGVLAGAFLIDSLMNGMTLMAVSPEMKFVTRGLVLTLAVWMDVRLSRRALVKHRRIAGQKTKDRFGQHRKASGSGLETRRAKPCLRSQARCPTLLQAPQIHSRRRNIWNWRPSRSPRHPPRHIPPPINEAAARRIVCSASATGNSPERM